MTDANLLREEIETLTIEINSLKGRMGSAGGTAAQSKKLDVLIRVRDRCVRALEKRDAA
ncbi:hypothetical protein GOZ96_04880 [Agrobacterium vitis]|uniref:hypothetical protein n=1 Tax=Agrobacterium vitis TaxID=373 RepID=UPI0012E79615|nr:hypothetical protein [Agrobacterium vitis]MUZ95924.1 hypothetical protein [Agrobacterium vitis]